MYKRFMITAAAAALIAGTGLAYAQGTGANKEGPSASPGAHQSAPSSSSMNREGGAEHGMKSTQSEERGQSQGAKHAQDMKSSAGEKSAQDNMKGEKSEKSKSMQNEKSTQNEKGAASKDMKAEGREDRSGHMKAEGREERTGTKAEGREERSGTKAEGREERSGTKAESREERSGTKVEGREERGTMNAQGREGRSETVGQAGGGAKLTTEQRTRMTTVFKEQHVAPVNNVNFVVSVGTRVPRDIGFHALPQEIVTIYPEWRGYEYFLVRDEIVVVDPRTLEIVAVLPA
jgi:hypothetical protein